METFTKFLYDFLGQFFSGIRIIFQGLGKGLKETVNIGSYSNIIQKYKGDFSMPEWILVAICSWFNIVNFCPCWTIDIFNN